MRLSAQIRKMLQSHPTHSQMQMWIKEAEKLEMRVEAAERHVETLQQRDLFEVEAGHEANKLTGETGQHGNHPRGSCSD